MLIGVGKPHYLGGFWNAALRLRRSTAQGGSWYQGRRPLILRFLCDLTGLSQ